MDVVSQAIINATLASQLPSSALNIAHPRPSPWSAIVSSMADALYQERAMPEKIAIISFTEWFERLERRAIHANAEDLVNIVSLTRFSLCIDSKLC